ncbi:LysR substrate-binding domain-containing protein [Roseateles cellulosilyticus]|uniref:LysR substrate-binding domain-containing protein n=1 Tax=Pelomonas cellulosilytica TaxID=2906762 RepID=A0ABS8Y3Y5_9BURK|nr:LysR substrate-binding domain-containing protein [Pelomonas sp. P8]MCE4557956.1 LysR substrate-binding domain-containing protein [Pelomonas sp. P8]
MPQVEKPQRAIERNEADMLVYPREYCSLDHPIERLWEEEFVCIVSASSSHARQPLTFERYVEAGHVVMQPPDSAPSFESWFLQRYGVSRKVEVTTYNFNSVAMLVANTERIATMHRRHARLAQLQQELILLPPRIDMPKMEQSLQWHKYRTQDQGLVWLRRLMHSGVQRMDAQS